MWSPLCAEKDFFGVLISHLKVINVSVDLGRDKDMMQLADLGKQRVYEEKVKPNTHRPNVCMAAGQASVEGLWPTTSRVNSSAEGV